MFDWMSWGVFNANSPSSDPKIVNAIVDEFMPAPDALALDIGGTRTGFVRQLPPSAVGLQGRVRLVNPMRDVPDKDRYQLVMCFGTLMYMSKEEIRETFEKAGRLLNAGGSILISDMDGDRAVVWIELALKWIAKIFVWSMPWRAHSKRDVAVMLEEAGFVVSRRGDLEPARGRVLTAISPMSYYVLRGHKPEEGSPP